MTRRTAAGVLACALTIITTAHAQTPTQEILVRKLQEGTSEERRNAAGVLGDMGDDAAVPHLIDALKDDDGVVRELAEHSLWAIWNRSGDPKIDALLQEGIHLLQSDRLDEAIATFDEVVKGAPGFPEGYNRRATAYYLAGQYEKSIADCEETIRRNPMHFGALSGLGYNYFKLGKLGQAIRHFERALDINPNKPRIRSMVIELKRVRGERAKDSI
ncbi:MAG: tetratricopeptide repeat protein [Candidatus Methylomirabilis oxyfera]|nr:tetratricopeptide repeat protein [Candidatus Methylomirabilis oxyfera]